MDLSSDSSREAAVPQSPKGVFPGGVRRAEVRLPGLVLRVRLEEMSREEQKNLLLEEINTAVAGGVTMIILEDSGDGGLGGARLYDAGCMLKTMLRGRAELLIAERVDIAAASGADGVLLTDEGLPAVVARRMMQNSGLETSVLPLVARCVSSVQSAQTATAGEGADLLILEVNDKEKNLVKGVCDGISIPVFLEISGSGVASAKIGTDFLQDGANGLVLSTAAITKNGGGDLPNYVSSLVASVNLAIERRKEMENSYSPEKEKEIKDFDVEDGGALLGLTEDVAVINLDMEEDSVKKKSKKIVDEERALLTAMVDFVEDASPEMEEVSLLVDALKQLDELFLSVVVGEFNSGKSSIINALLGKRYLKEGVLPTTNEITVLRHSTDGGDAEEREERHPDGHFLRFLPANILKQMNLVDTPGTNVILQRQQRLTEEFVPRADLILFVLSADRALTESEVTFLRYIKQWGKKIVFILNKSDVLPTYNEVEEVRNFVRDNAQRLLTVEQALVYPVSARQALQAKLSALLEDGTVDVARLSEDPLWTTSGFKELEEFIFGFMGASTDRGAERLRLKLETPLGISFALLAACEQQLTAEASKAESDLKVLEDVRKRLQKFEEAMLNGAILQRLSILAVIEAVKGRAEKFVDSILRLSNVEAIGKYLLGSGGVRSMPVSSGFDSKVIGSAVTDVEKALKEYKEWMESNSIRQLSSYRSLIISRWPQVKEDSQHNVESSPVVDLRNRDSKHMAEQSSRSLTTLMDFDTNAAIILLEQEFKEVVVSIFSGVGAAGISASVLTSILPTTLEDLIALGVCSAGGLVGVWKLPSQREVVKKKVRRVADSLARQIEEAMKDDLQKSIDAVRAEVETLTAPYLNAVEEKLRRVEILQEESQKLDSELKRLRQSVQSIGI
nr:probable transmembrane GTPase FZO-like, chloroplastic isoform X2 [Physcomitrium patens]|eukprot:XP_024371207.1 probable transmembrane GTPase FZO-like, chloroplastic isoform X2 [Physcomitrella patens]